MTLEQGDPTRKQTGGNPIPPDCVRIEVHVANCGSCSTRWIHRRLPSVTSTRRPRNLSSGARFVVLVDQFSSWMNARVPLCHKSVSRMTTTKLTKLAQTVHAPRAEKQPGLLNPAV